MKLLITSFAVIALLSTVKSQFENGFVKILEDQRYQDGASFGNFRNQEDGIKYQEETDAQGIRRGFWEYPDETGQIKRVEFEAGKGIGFRIISSNIVAPTPQHAASQPQPQPKQPKAQPVHVPLVRQPPVPQQPIIRQIPTTTTPGPINLFDYPADLQFFRDAGGHRFKFTAT